MEQADNLLLRIQKYDKTFSKGQKRLAAYVLKNYDGIETGERSGRQ